jgi:hypothetical protein
VAQLLPILNRSWSCNDHDAAAAGGAQPR